MFDKGRYFAYSEHMTAHRHKLAWGLEGLVLAVDGDPAHAALEVELDVVPLAVVERQARGAHVDRPRPQVQVHAQVPLQQLHREVVLGEGREGAKTFMDERIEHGTSSKVSLAFMQPAGEVLLGRLK